MLLPSGAKDGALRIMVVGVVVRGMRGDNKRKTTVKLGYYITKGFFFFFRKKLLRSKK